VKLFKMNDCDWYAAETADDALKAMTETLCYEATPESVAAMRKDYDVSEPVELTDEDMKRLVFCDDLENGAPDFEGSRRPFAEQLALMVAAGVEFPCFFASTEY